MNFIDWQIIHFERIESTNSYAKTLANTEPKGCFAILADYQSGGRGQFGRIWESEPGKNLLCSLLIPCEGRDFNMIDFGKGFALTMLKVIQTYTHRHLTIKWPNDIFADDKKLAGILIETLFRGSELTHIIVGFGVNIMSYPTLQGDTATSLSACSNQIIDPRHVLMALLSRCDSIMYGQEKEIIHEYDRNLYKFNQLVQCISKNQEIQKGQLLGVDNLGKLQLETRNGVSSLVHGEWSLLL